MGQYFITEIKIDKVRHLEDMVIPLSLDEKKHLILTGKNGSGKTSLLEAMKHFLFQVICITEKEKAKFRIGLYSERVLPNLDRWMEAVKEEVDYGKGYAENTVSGIGVKVNTTFREIGTQFEEGKFIAAYYPANREFQINSQKHVEKVEFKENYLVDEKPRAEFILYLRDLKMTQALALASGKKEKADGINQWFTQFEGLLKRIFEDDSLSLIFDEDTFEFSITMDGREKFDFNTLSSGYAAIMDIVVDLMMRMEKHTNKVFDYSIPGIVLIDEIETHLHLNLQKSILDMLTTIFPNIQFIVSTHSPFILNSLENAVIYDLEKKILVENGFTNVPYSGIVEGYFKVDELSLELKDKFEQYKLLVAKQKLTDEDFDTIAKLEVYLDEIPDYLALGFTTEYQRLKLELRKRDDI